jgi:3-methyladenine DNA glycosylase Tag
MLCGENSRAGDRQCFAVLAATGYIVLRGGVEWLLVLQRRQAYRQLCGLPDHEHRVAGDESAMNTVPAKSD